MKKFFLLILFLFININVLANEDLVNLSVNGESVSCSGYECQIEIDGTSAEITYEKGENVKSTTPESGHTVSLNNNYSLQIEVTYNDDTTANYTLTIKKHMKSNDNTLKSLIINDEEVVLKEEIFVYSFETKFNDETVKIKGIPNDSNAKCDEKEYEFDLESSSLSVTYPVMAEDGTSRDYTIILKRKNKPDTTLKTLKIKDVDFEFNKDILDYEITVPYNVNNIEIEAIANNSKASVKIVKDELLVVGENVVEIIVTNEDVSDTYAIRVNRLENLDENQVNLSSLKIADYDFEFNPTKLEYTLTFKEVPTSLSIDAKSINDEATVEVLNNETLTDGSVVSIKVSLSNGLVKTYKLNIKKELVLEKEVNKTLVLILIIILILTMIILLVLQLKERNKNRKTKKKSKVSKKNKVKETKEIIKEEEIELI